MQLRADNVTVKRSGRTLVSGFSLDVKDGELVGLIGPNGAGKSTLLSVLAGLSTCDSGQVMLDDTPIASVRDRSKILAWVEQSGPVNWPLTVERIVTLGRRPHLGAWHRPGDADISAIERAITDTDCTDIRHQDATTLSGGERTRMMLARALAAEPEILLADEPVAALDLGHQIQTMELLRRFSSQRQSCVVVLHDLSLAARYCDRLYLMDRGKAVAHGSPGAVLSHANLREVYGVEVAVGCDEVPWIVPLRQVDPSI